MPRKRGNSNELSSRKVHEPVNVKSIKQDDTEITNPYDIANAFNTYFTTIGDSLANELPHSDINPISYLYPVNSSFSFAQINVETVIETLKAANSNKATGPDNIPVRVLKIAAEILSPSLTAIFNRFSLWEFTQTIGRWLECYPFLKAEKRVILAIIDRFQLYPRLLRCLADLFTTSSTLI